MADNPQSSSVPLAEITHGPSALEQFLDRNQKNLLVLLVLLIVGVIAFVMYRGVQDGKRLAAAQALFQANDIDALKKVIAEHAGTPSAGTATLKLAEQEWEKGQKEESIATLRSFLAQPAAHAAEPAAHASLAAKLMAEGNNSEAITIWENLLDDPAASYLAPFALLSLGDIALAAGDTEKGKRYYEQAQSEHATSAFNQQISQRMAAVHAAHPTPVDPPAPAITTAEELPSQPTPLIPAAPDAATESPADKADSNQP